MSQTRVESISQDELSQILHGKVDSILTPETNEPEVKVEEKTPEVKPNKVADVTFSWKELENIGGKEKEEGAPEEETNEQTVEKKPGRKPSDVVSLINDLVEAGDIVGFEDGPAKTIEEAKELIKMNIVESKKLSTEDIWKEKLESYSPQVQAIIHYAEQGGSDVTPLLSAIAEVENNANLNLDTEDGQEGIISEYLKVSGWSQEDIREEIETAKDLGKLKSKAEKFLPKLNQMNEQRIQLILEEQNERKREAEEARNKYLTTIKTNLEKEKLGEIKLTRQDKAMIWDGLTDIRHKSWSGQPTNLFFKRLEEMQAGDKADYEHFLEIVYHTLNRTSFKDKLKEEIKNVETAETVRKLKTQERRASTQETIFEEPSGKPVIKRQTFRNPWG